MRIAYLTSLYPAASHTFIRREVNALRAKGVEIHTFSVRGPELCSAAEDRASRDTTFYILPIHPVRLLVVHWRMLFQNPTGYLKTLRLALKHRANGLKELIWSVFYFAEAIIFADELKRRGISHVHNHFANASANVSYLATQFLNLPYSLTLHGNSETDYPAGVLLGDKLRAASFANCVSYYGRAQAYRTIPPSHWSKLDIVRCGIDLRDLPKRDETPRTLPRVICVARLTREKGHIGLLRAFARIRDTIPCELVLIGDGPEQASLSREIRELELTGSVHMLGAMSESATMAEIAQSDILVLASLIEGLPVVLLEAMALGVPVIAPNVAGIPDLIKDNKNGLLFAPTDWDGLYQCLKTMLSREIMRGQLAEAGRIEVETNYDINKIANILMKRFVSARTPTEGRLPLPFGLKKPARPKVVPINRNKLQAP